MPVFWTRPVGGSQSSTDPKPSETHSVGASTLPGAGLMVGNSLCGARSSSLFIGRALVPGGMLEVGSVGGMCAS